LDFTGNTDDLIVQKIVNRLQRAIISEEVRRKMDFEDEFYAALEDEYNKGVAEEAAKKDIIIAEKEQVINEKEQALIKKDQALVEKDQALVEKEQAIAKIIE
jgi:ribonucleotide reductase alpha subunit